MVDNYSEPELLDLLMAVDTKADIKQPSLEFPWACCLLSADRPCKKVYISSYNSSMGL